MGGVRGWWVAIFVFLGAASAQAGARTGWGWRAADFVGTATFYDGAGGVSGVYSAQGSFDFDVGTVALSGISDLFFGTTWSVPGGALTYNGGAGPFSYTGDLSFDWGASSYPVVVPWELTDLGGGSASLATVDGNGDGIPGLPMAAGPLSGASLAIDGTLTAIVPEPVSMALVAGGFGLLGLRRR